MAKQTDNTLRDFIDEQNELFRTLAKDTILWRDEILETVEPITAQPDTSAFERFQAITEQNDAAPATVTLSGDAFAIAIHLLDMIEHDTFATAAHKMLAESLLDFE